MRNAPSQLPTLADTLIESLRFRGHLIFAKGQTEVIPTETKGVSSVVQFKLDRAGLILTHLNWQETSSNNKNKVLVSGLDPESNKYVT